jgi:hypothetical protein
MLCAAASRLCLGVIDPWRLGEALVLAMVREQLTHPLLV